jgi:CubicO group peptidase (beta-lactamase class C family)
MEHQKMTRSVLAKGLGRRGFIGMSSAAALAAFLPVPAWAQLAEKYPTLRAKIDSMVDTRKVSGIVAAIGRGSAAPEILAKGTLAMDSQVPVDIDSLFRIYSMTKPITGIAAMMLVDQGKIKLDQPIADFLPEFANMTVLTDGANSMDAVPSKTAITLRHLLTHTAGFGYAIITKGPLLRAYIDAGINPGQISRMPIPGLERGTATPDLATFSKRLAALPLIAEPGTKWSYSVSLDLLGHLIAVVSGMEFDAFLQSQIFGPLKMTSSFFQVPQSEIPRFTTNYGAFGGFATPIDPAASSIYLDKPPFAFGGAGLVSSARDYDRFLHMLMNSGTLDGATLMSPETAKLAMSNLLPAGADTSGTWVAGAGFGAGGRSGLGMEAGSFGWGGAAGTNAFVHTGLQLRATGMVQYMPSDVYDFQADFPKWVIADVIAGMGK